MVRQVLLTAVFVVALVGLHVGPAARAQSTPGPGWAAYRDARGRFSLLHPEAWGVPGIGTNDGFGNRVAAVRFPNLPGLGGELAVIRGRVTLDMQALGGLYDPIALEALPDAVAQQVVAAVAPVSADNICQLLASADHVGTAPALPAAVRDVASRLDRMRNVSPRVVRCDRQGDLVVFHKEASFETSAASARQHIVGAVRFLRPPDSAVHLVRVLPAPPSAEDLDVLARVVMSFAR